MYHHRRLLQQQNDVVDKQPANDVSPSLLVTVLILAIAVILSASLYLLLRFLRRNTTSTSTTTRSIPSTSPIPRHVSLRVSPLVDALPLFTSESLKSTGGGDCAVCLSKFEKKDLLRLLPICCHVFHADCIDTWLNSSQSCPLCRSPVFLPESELLSKLNNNNHNSNDVTSSSPASLSSSSRSFRVEIGNVSRRNANTITNNNSGELPVHRSYSLGGNFDYVVEDDVVSEVHSGSFRRTTSSSEFKLDSDYQQQQQQLASEVGTRGGGGGGGWLKEYLAHSLSNSLSSSFRSSFRSSGRWFFTGSSRRENTPTMMTSGGGELGMSEMDMESSRLGDEIGELFRWLSGV